MLKTFHVKSIIRMSNVETNYHGKTEITINAQEHTVATNAHEEYVANRGINNYNVK